MNYYESKDLGRFAEVGTFRKEQMDKFFEYYTLSTSEEGALSKKEKSLIGLAVAHIQHCPYCIEAYSKQCLESGATPDQMTEALHVAAAIAAGITLVHGVQMLNHLEKHDVL